MRHDKVTLPAEMDPPRHGLRATAVRARASAWVGFTVLILAATQVHPGFASLFTIAAIALLLILMRWLAHVEGRWGR